MKLFTVVSTNIHMLKKIMRYCPAFFIASFIFSLLGSIVNLVNLVILRELINALLSDEGFQRITNLVVLSAAIGVVFSALNSIYSTIIRPVSIQNFQKQMHSELFAKAALVDVSCYDDTSFYNGFSLALQQSDSRAVSIMDTFFSFISNVFSCYALVSLIYVLDSHVLCMVIVNVVGCTLISFVQSSVQHRFNKQSIPLGRLINYIKRIFFQREYCKEIRLSGLANLFGEKFENYTDRMKNVIFEFVPQNLACNGGQSIISTICNSGILFSIAKKTYFQLLNIADFSTIITGSQQFRQSLTNVIHIFPQLSEHTLYAKDFIEFERLADKLSMSKKERFPSTPRIIANKMTFGYDEQSYVLENISFNINFGEKIAIVGENGSGKSTLIKLITGLYSPTNGAITFNNVPCAEVNRVDLSKHISVLFQDFALYSTTIAENVLMRTTSPNNGQDQKNVENALNYVGLLDKINCLPQGINTELTKEFSDVGVLFSGGELKRIALSRIFVQDPSVVILDEPLNSLDYLSIDLFWNALLDFCSNRTLIVVTHKVQDLSWADKILVFNRGCIAEEGTHSELIRKKGIYSAMYNSTSS